MKIEQQIQATLQKVFQDESILFDQSRFAGGLTNYNYIMKIHGTEYVIRRPGDLTDEMIDRKAEKINNEIASELGVNSTCIFFDDSTGIKISIFIKDSNNIAYKNPCSPKNIQIVCDLLKRLHYSGRVFENVFDWHAELHKYEQIIRQLNGEFFFDYEQLKQMLCDFRKQYIQDIPLLPCHNDTVPENFVVDAAGKGCLIDWEYSGMNDPCWDLAAYIVESRLTKQAIKTLLNTYFKSYSASEEIRIKCYMMEQDLLWTVWALIRHYNGDNFLEYCAVRYERFRKNIHALTNSIDYPLYKMVQ